MVGSQLEEFATDDELASPDIHVGLHRIQSLLVRRPQRIPDSSLQGMHLQSVWLVC